MRKIIKSVFKFKWQLLATALLLIGAVFYFATQSNTGSAASFYVVDSVKRGEVTSGIQTTGSIIAEQKLDIDVYKQLSRIDKVNIVNGSHVEAGDILVSFDKNDAYVNMQTSRVAVLEAELSLENKQATSNNPSTQIRTAENQISGYQKTINDTKQAVEDAYIDFLNENLETKPSSNQNDRLSHSTQPSISGRYASDAEGEYGIEVYSSGAPSGYSYRVSGLESYTGSVIFGTATDLGTRGLKITFPMAMADTVRTRDTWTISIPNKSIATHEESRRNYEQRVANLKKTIQDAEVSLANTTQELENMKRTDSAVYRNLDVEKAQASLAEAKQRLSRNYDVVQERDIVAPFSGTVEGMENVVEGATPTGGTSDSVNLGMLISDKFLTTFSLGAADVSKLTVGQKVKVTVTSFSQQPVFEATITQISSLPTSGSVAQYGVQALLDYDRTTAELILREGMLADIEVVEEEKSDALRVPTSAIKYVQGVPKITIIDQLTQEQQEQVSRMGIVRTEGTTIITYDADIVLGIVGQYYVEIVSGLSEGDIIVTSTLTDSGNTTEQQGPTGFGGGSVRIQGSMSPGGTGSNMRQSGGGSPAN